MLLSDVRFWTCGTTDFSLKEPSDLAIFKYNADKNAAKAEDVYVEGKAAYSVARGTKFCLDNKKPHRLRRNLKKLETELRSHSVVHCEWIFSNIVQIMLSNGLLVHVVLNSMTSDVTHVSFDKFLVGKLVSTAVNNGEYEVIFVCQTQIPKYTQPLDI